MIDQPVPDDDLEVLNEDLLGVLALPIDTIPVGAMGSMVPPEPIGIGRPLSIRLGRMYPGPVGCKDMLVASSVRNPSLYAASPWAMHYLFHNVQAERPLLPSPSQDGSDVVFYSPAILDDALDIEVRFARDNFDPSKYEKVIGAAGKALPAFLVGALGVAGAAAAAPVIYLAERAAKLVLNAVDRLVDQDNDWVSTWRLSIARGGFSQSRAGWYVLLDNETDAQLVAEELGELAGGASAEYVVRPSDGMLMYADSPNTIVAGIPWVTVFVDGKAEAPLKDWTRTAVSAAVATRFLNDSGDPTDDFVEALTVFSDMRLVGDVIQVDRELEDTTLDQAARAALEQRRLGLLRNIQDADVKRAISD